MQITFVRITFVRIMKKLSTVPAVVIGQPICRVKSIYRAALVAAFVGGFASLAASSIARPAAAQQRPSAETRACSTATQSCSNAILADGPLSVSAGESSQINVDGTRGLTLEQISNMVNERTDLGEDTTRLGIGPVEINSGDRDRLGVRDNVLD